MFKGDNLAEIILFETRGWGWGDLSIGLCLNVYELVSFELGQIIVTTELCTLIYYSVILAFIKGYMRLRRQILLHHYLTKFPTDPEKI